MPRGILTTLCQITTLQNVHIELSHYRSNIHDCEQLLAVFPNIADLILPTVPFWELSKKLKSLSIDFAGYVYRYPAPIAKEQSEAALNSVSVPLQRQLVDKVAVEAYHVSIACRTIVAAARGGQLRVLKCTEQVQAPFAVRALLPSGCRSRIGASTARTTSHGWEQHSRFVRCSRTPLAGWARRQASTKGRIAF